MSNATVNLNRECPKRQLEDIASSMNWDACPMAGQAIRGVLTALDYHDPVLMRAHLLEAMERFRELVEGGVQEALDRWQQLRELWRKSWESLQGQADENSLDDLGKSLESALAAVMDRMVKLRECVQQFRDRGYEVEGADRLQEAIEGVHEFRKGVLGNWPWASQSAPPVDRDMIARSRAAIAGGEKGERIEDVIRRFGG